MKKLLLTTTAAIGMAAIFPANAAQAQSTDQPAAESSADENAQTSGLYDIVVTAQRRQESVQDVPIAISAFDEAEMDRRGISNALDIAQYVPNFVGLNNTGLGSANAYYIRGIGNGETIATFDPPIGTYVDDIYISRQNANNLSLFDVQRVEVLRGPQGTLFGRNTTGGAVNLFMKEPGDEVAGYVEAGYGSYERYMARASIDIPLADTFAVKVSGYFQDDEGYAKNSITGERTNESDSWGARLGFRGELSDTTRWTGSYMHINTKALNLLNFDCDPADPTNCDGRFVTTGLTKDGNFGGLLYGKKDNFGLGNDTNMDFVSSNLEFGSGEDISVNIITGYVYTTQDYALDFADGRALPTLNDPVPGVQGYTMGGFTVANVGEYSQFTQEVKVNASLGDGLIDLVGGAFYFEEDNYSDFADIFSIPGAPGGIPLVLADRTLRNTTRAYAGYLQGDLNITDQLTLTAGIRYTDETKKFSIRDNRESCNDGSVEATCLTNANLVAANGTAIPREMSTKLWTPRFAVNYQVDRDILLFASATRGFKSGGWNARGTSLNELLPFGPEKAWSYEAGFKSELLDNRLRVNLTAYYLDVGGLQTPAGFVKPNGSIAFITRNFADYVNKGIELEINAAPVDGLNLFASAGYQDDKYKINRNAPDLDEYGVISAASQQAACLAQLNAGLAPIVEATSCGAGIVTADGSIAEPIRTPDFSLAFGGSYEAQFGNGLSLIPAVNVSWRGESEVATNNVSFYSGGFTSPNGSSFPSNPYDGDFLTGSLSKSRWMVNSNITLKSEDGWSFSAECANCLDKESVETSLANYTYIVAPRTFLLKGRFEF
ncbi:MAG: TonB-dependent receptor [Parasphingorhabdus sp.]